MKRIVSFACLMCLCLTTASAAAQSNVLVEPSKQLVNQTIKVAPGSSAYYKLSLTQGTTLVAAFTVEGGLENKVDVSLLDIADFQQYQARQRFANRTSRGKGPTPMTAGGPREEEREGA